METIDPWDEFISSRVSIRQAFRLQVKDIVANNKVMTCRIVTVARRLATAYLCWGSTVSCSSWVLLGRNESQVSHMYPLLLSAHNSTMYCIVPWCYGESPNPLHCACVENLYRFVTILQSLCQTYARPSSTQSLSSRCLAHSSARPAPVMFEPCRLGGSDFQLCKALLTSRSLNSLLTSRSSQQCV